jgi:uncharacterized protein (DUF433 family)
MIMNDWKKCLSVEQDPKRVSGAWVFRGTRIPVIALFENLEDGLTVSEFIEYFPGVNSSQVHDVLQYASKSLKAA